MQRSKYLIMNLINLKYRILLQSKFILVALMNISYTLIPNPFRKYYLRLFGIRINKGSTIHRYCRFFHLGGLTIGQNSTINFGCYLDNRRGISIGDNVGIAHNTKIYTLGHDINDSHFNTRGAKVQIEDNVFIFSNSLIMPGVTIGEGAVVLSGSVVTKDVEPWSIVGGNPATKIKNRNKNIAYNQSYKYWFAL